VEGLYRGQRYIWAERPGADKEKKKKRRVWRAPSPMSIMFKREKRVDPEKGEIGCRKNNPG